MPQVPGYLKTNTIAIMVPTQNVDTMACQILHYSIFLYLYSIFFIAIVYFYIGIQSLFVSIIYIYSLYSIICIKYLGPVVQSIVSLMKSLVNDSLSLLVRLKSSVLIFFAEKMLLTFFRQKMAVFYVWYVWNFNVTLTNDVVSFEQLGPVHFYCICFVSILYSIISM